MVEIKDIFSEDHANKLKGARTAGIDIGSRATKGVLLYDGKLYHRILTSGVSGSDTGEKILNLLLKDANTTKNQLDYLIGTGYGRVALDFEGIPFQGLTEISCHAMGAHYLKPETRTIIDIGGQDSKAIKIDPENGKVIEFIMNDKCAAGTGRFLEKVAQLLELELDELGEYAVRSDNPVEISSQCVVFAESEVISLKAKGSSQEDIAAGIHIATARRIKSLLRRTGFEPGILFTGGVSNNPGMKKALEQILEVGLLEAPFDSTLAGALGAAIYASEFADLLRASYGGGL